VFVGILKVNEMFVIYL